MSPSPRRAAAHDRLVIGSRRSRLARTQAEHVGTLLEAAWPGLSVSYVAISTAGDRDRVTPLPEIGGKGLFTEDLERALDAGEIDLAVHSLKDLPTGRDEELVAIPRREDPRDVLVLAPSIEAPSGGLADLPPGLTVGTSSTRRAAQARRFLREPDVRPLRGNVGTRLARVESGELDAAVLAAAGLARLGIAPHGIALDPAEWPGAPGQGALAVQGRAADPRVADLARAVHDADTGAATAAERAFLARLGGGCHVPVAALGEVRAGRLELRGAVYGPVGDPAFIGEETGDPSRAAELGHTLAGTLLDRGAARLLDASVRE